MGYSIWKGDYKYNEELTMVFMSCNLIGGMHQRLEKLKKNAFASCCLFGENNNSSISGIWVFRGHELAFELSEDWQIDYASYDWKKLDSKSEDCKKLVTSTGSGREKTKRDGSSTRERFSNKLPQILPFIKLTGFSSRVSLAVFYAVLCIPKPGAEI